MSIAYSIRSFRTNKPGESLWGCEDAIGLDPKAHAFAVADGVTTSFYPQLLAQILCKRFCQHSATAIQNTAKWVKACQDEWREQMEAICKSPSTGEVTREGFRDGDIACATFFGLKLDPLQGKWTGLYLGDACLLQFRNGKLFGSLPLSSKDQFSFATRAVPSAGDCPNQGLTVAEGNIATGDVLVLATDSLAKSLLAESSAASALFDRLLQVKEPGDFVTLVEERRRSKNASELNDDIAVVIIDCNSCDMVPVLAIEAETNSRRNPVPDPVSGFSSQLASTTSAPPEVADKSSTHQTNLGYSPRDRRPQNTTKTTPAPSMATRSTDHLESQQRSPLQQHQEALLRIHRQVVWLFMAVFIFVALASGVLLYEHIRIGELRDDFKAFRSASERKSADQDKKIAELQRAPSKALDPARQVPSRPAPGSPGYTPNNPGEASNSNFQNKQPPSNAVSSPSGSQTPLINDAPGKSRPLYNSKLLWKDASTNPILLESKVTEAIHAINSYMPPYPKRGEGQDDRLPLLVLSGDKRVANKEAVRDMWLSLEPTKIEEFKLHAKIDFETHEAHSSAQSELTIRVEPSSLKK